MDGNLGSELFSSILILSDINWLMADLQKQVDWVIMLQSDSSTVPCDSKNTF